MGRRLPSLNALKAFEAAARLESFTDAAAELFVTHAAVSRHIRDLEEWLGTELFVRTGRGVTLTDAGRNFGSRLTALFDQLADATRDAAAAGNTRLLKVSVEPALASRWLVPRLGGFRSLHPDIELAIEADVRLVNFRTGAADIGMRYGRGPWEDVEAVKLADSLSFPVCAPALIASEQNLKPSDLNRFTLLHEERKQWWEDWLRAAGVTSGVDWRGPVFQAHLAIEAAEAGQGFALGDQILCLDSIREGWLVRPFNIDVRDYGAYWIVRAKGSRESAPARAFREWVMSEMAETNKRYAQLTGQRPAAVAAKAGSN